jgi:hypothetical protein
MTTRPQHRPAEISPEAAPAPSDASDARAAGVPEQGRSVAEQHLGAGLGVLAGAAAGALAGPIGMAVGASLGAVIGEAAGAAMHEREEQLSTREHELDDAIGVTAGPLGGAEITDFVQPAKAATFLRADHELMDDLAARVLARVAEDDREDLGDAVTYLQSHILAHFEGEERDVIPAYAHHDPHDARALLADHAAIREALAGLDVATDLHLIRLDAVRALLDKLRAHAKRENAGLYRWATQAGSTT